MVKKKKPTNFGSNNTDAWATWINANSGAVFGAAGQTGAPGYGTGPAAPPYDPALEAQKTANTARRTTLGARADRDLYTTSQDYGFGYNPVTGAVGGFDPTNPFSQAALLMKARKERDQGENTSFASQGQLNSGAYGLAKKETGSAYNKGYDALRRGFLKYLTGYMDRKADIQTVPIEELANL